MTTMLIACNETRESGSFMGDQLCSLKTAYLFVQNESDVDKVIISLSPTNEMAFLWQRFIDDPKGDGSIPKCDVVYDNWNPGDWTQRWQSWDKWRTERHIEDKPFDTYKELYLRIHGLQRQQILCGYEKGLGRRNIYEYWAYGQESSSEICKGSDSFDDTLIYHPAHKPERDVYISPHAKTQGNATFTFDYWSRVVHKLIEADITVTVGYNSYFCGDLNGHPLYRKFFGNHEEWMNEVCRHKLVACGNTGTGWLAAACGVPMITMEPHNSCMADHRYRECGLKNIIEVIDGYKLDEFDNNMDRVADYCAQRIIEQVNRVVVMTTGCYDILHAGHVRHLEKSRALGTKLIVALNSDDSIHKLKGTIDGIQRPINSQLQRKTVLEALRCVDEVRLFDDTTPEILIQEIKPDILTAGFGYTADKIVGKTFVESYGGRAIVTCEKDAYNETVSTTKIARKIIRTGDIIEVCRIASTVSVNPMEKLRLLADQFLSVVHLEGDVADLGAYRGGTSLILRRLAPNKKLHIFDTWEGTPIDDDLCHHKKGEWQASLEQCQQLVGNGELTHYHKGVFPYSTYVFRAGAIADVMGSLIFDGVQFCFAYIDSDTYQSVNDAIDFFWPRLVKGGKLLFDDYNWPPCAGVEKAIHEAFSQEQLTVFPQQYTCVVEKR